MEKDRMLYEKMPMPNRGFLFKMHDPGKVTDSVLFSNHWHESMELLFMVSGKALFQCNSRSFEAQRGDLVVVNSCDLHEGRCLEGTVSYYCIIFDTELLHTSSADICETKYLEPIKDHKIMFRNRISGDEEISQCILSLTNENKNREKGYELAIKGTLFRLFAILLRRYQVKSLSGEEYESKKHRLEQLNLTVDYLEENYREKIEVDHMASMVNMSRYHFCRSFKEATGRTLSDYVNQIRINKADYLLKTTHKNITEIAMETGFNDLNYFSRVYKRYAGQTATHARGGKKH